MAPQNKSGLVVFLFFMLVWVSLCPGQTPQPPATEAQLAGAASSAVPASTPGLPSSVSGTVVDQDGAVVPGAHVRLTGDESLNQEAVTDKDGQFSFADIPPGHFQLTVTAAGFSTQTYSGLLQAGQIETVPPIALTVATDVTEVQVTLTQTEVAEQQMKVEEQQRILGAIPNFFVSYTPDAVPLTSKQKFKLSWKMVIDPVTFLMVGGAAGVEQAQNHFNGYGQGSEGYAKRFGASYADTVVGTFFGGAIFPSLLKQDPRYFYKGTGSKPSRFLYAVANTFICKGDNGHWQPGYSNILGSLAAGGVSNIYYPAADRDGFELTFENAAIGLAATAATNVLQEFVIRHFTPKASKNDPSLGASPTQTSSKP
jgi:hypothetical protein